MSKHIHLPLMFDMGGAQETLTTQYFVLYLF